MAGVVRASIGAVTRGAAASAGAAVPDGMVGTVDRAGAEWVDTPVVGLASAADRVAAAIQAVDIQVVDIQVVDIRVADIRAAATRAEDIPAAATDITEQIDGPSVAALGPSSDRSGSSRLP
jgi:hypothetical protein